MKDATKKAKADSLQDELDQYVNVQDMFVGVSGFRPIVDDTKGGSVAEPSSATVADLVW